MTNHRAVWLNLKIKKRIGYKQVVAKFQDQVHTNSDALEYLCLRYPSTLSFASLRRGRASLPWVVRLRNGYERTSRWAGPLRLRLQTGGQAPTPHTKTLLTTLNADSAVRQFIRLSYPSTLLRFASEGQGKLRNQLQAGRHPHSNTHSHNKHTHTPHPNSHSIYLSIQFLKSFTRLRLTFISIVVSYFNSRRSLPLK